MATNARTLDVEAFMQEVTQRNLSVKEPAGGYLYAGYQGPNGWEVIRCPANPWYFYQSNRVVTQDNAGGGALRLNYTIPAGQFAILVRARLAGSANVANVIELRIYDSAGWQCAHLMQTTAGSNKFCYIPTIGTIATTSDNLVSSDRMLIGPGEVLVADSGITSQTQIMQFQVAMLLSTAVAPTITTTGSAGTPNLGAALINETPVQVVLPV